MKIVLASEYFYPQTKGGTEMYVYQLAAELIAHGNECIVISLSDELTEANYLGIPIYYIPFVKDDFLDSKNPKNLKALINLLDKIKPDIFHLHTISPSLGVSHILHLKEIGYKTVLTSHLPSFTCTRGDLLLMGKEICDGELIYNRCMKCVLNSKGYNNKFLNSMITDLSKLDIVNYFFPSISSVKNKFKSIENFIKNIDFVIVVSEWQKKIFLKIGFSASKLKVCRQAVANDYILNIKKNRIKNVPVIGFIGRIVQGKGIEFLLDNLMSNISANYSLSIAAIKSNGSDQYFENIKMKSSFLNANWLEDLDANGVKEFIDTIDLLAAPSLWLETGPYVIYEALARKVPVIAFNRGGAVELIKNNVNGFLVNSAEEFNEKLNYLIDNPSKIDEFSANIEMDRTTNFLYLEMEEVYQKVLQPVKEI